ncbi:hypothetical protein BZA05DRAFT_368833 [Tricharina praecox]|uniref:uncharacterized protein n=1 Tax=Tricharina praecox TaxID=43433 RepID=UPI002220F7F3|nr:uncharacterized protein BZA05DRAFT_368833 [Tricharina praecox]KAI5856366.1 hypothetical protein BZA05DRAFT_368833 [Tricharina praecox]
MDLLKNFTGGSSSKKPAQQPASSGGFMDRLHGAAGGGPQSEHKEDALDKAIDMFQEKVLGQGPQNNENAFEQRKDEAISDFIRGQYKSATGKEFPVADK